MSQTSFVAAGAPPAADDPVAYRTPPANVEAEQALLGALLVNNRALDKVGDFLRAEHFFDPAHGRIFQAITKLIEKGQLANPVTLRSLFADDADLASVGGAGYLAELAASVVTVVNAADYGHAIHDHFLRRQVIQIGEDMVNEAYRHSLERTATDHIEEAERQLFELATTGDVKGGFVALGDALGRAIEVATAAYRRDSQITGVTTGLADVDRKLGGLHNSDLVILAGRPSMGKTALATNIGVNSARRYLETEGREGAVAGFFSLEMSAEQLATRILADLAGVSSDKIRRGDVKDSDFPRFLEASHTLSRVPFFIDDTPALSVGTLRTRARRLKRTHGLGLIIIDYVQLMRGGGINRSENRVQELSEITRGLKAIAKELDVPVVALSQLSRAVEQRDDKRPQLADLRESGSIEQDADVVMFVYREQYYHERREPVQKETDSPDEFRKRYETWRSHGERVHNIAEVILAKQRHGPIGTVKLHFDGEFTRFSDLDPHHQSVPA